MSSIDIEAEIFDLIPHRPPMLLISKIQSLDKNSSQALVIIDKDTPFFQFADDSQVADGSITADGTSGVPSWVGLEYMGQTAALIAGYQLREGLTKPHLGFLLGCRNYSVSQAYFTDGMELLVTCSEAALVGDSLATFSCTIVDNQNKQELAKASLSVFRKPLDSPTVLDS